MSEAVEAIDVIVATPVMVIDVTGGAIPLPLLVEVAPIAVGVPEAPQDGKLYGRRDGAWVEIP